MSKLSFMNKTNVPVAVFVGALVFFLCVVIAWPLAIIWALNTLFVSLSIPYGFWSWLAVVILNISTFGGLTAAVKNND